MATGFAGESLIRHPHPTLSHPGGGLLLADFRRFSPPPSMGEGRGGVKKRLAGEAGGNISFLPRYIHKL